MGGAILESSNSVSLATTFNSRHCCQTHSAAVSQIAQHTTGTEIIIIIIIIIIIQHLYSAIMSYADTEALVAPVKSE